MKRKLFTLLMLLIVIISCKDNNLEKKVVTLQKTNDSLKTILDTLKTKYIFDNVFVRQIPSEFNSNKVGSKYKGEFFFVAYNDEDAVLFTETRDDFSNADTLRIKRRTLGSYDFETILKDTTYFTFRPIIKNTTAVQFQNRGYQGLTITDRKISK